MKLRRLLFIVPLCLALGACLDPTGPRFPDDTEEQEEPEQNQLVVARGH